MQAMIRFVAGVFVTGGVVAGGAALPRVYLQGHTSTEVRSNVGVATPGLPSMSGTSATALGAAAQAHGTASATVDTGADAVARAATQLRGRALQVAADGRTAVEGAVAMAPSPSAQASGGLGAAAGGSTTGLSAGADGHASLTAGLPTIKVQGEAGAGLSAGATLTGKLR